MITRIRITIIVYSSLFSAARSTVYAAICGLILLSFVLPGRAAAVEDSADPLVFDDTPLKDTLSLPAWFKLSFLDIKEDLREANAENRGLIIYFGRNDCPYCKALLEKDWGREDIKIYTQRYFDVIAIDVLGQRQLTDPEGRETTEKAYAARQRANFTPTLHIYDRHGKLAFKLTGYRPPYQFKAVLEYVADEHYQQESFADYYARAEAADSYGNQELNRQADFRYSDKLIDLSHSQKPVLVLFEEPSCHACDVLHSGPLQKNAIMQRLKRFNAVQLDLNSDQAVITPAGKRTTSRAWAKALYLDYTPTLMFYDEKGNEVVRIDSVVWFYRLRNVLDYVLDKGYLKYPTFQQWRKRK